MTSSFHLIGTAFLAKGDWWFGSLTFFAADAVGREASSNYAKEVLFSKFAFSETDFSDWKACRCGRQDGTLLELVMGKMAIVVVRHESRISKNFLLQHEHYILRDHPHRNILSNKPPRWQFG